jgi:hypothetical protein
VDGVAFYHLILAEKKQETFSDFLLGVPLCGRRVFSYKSSGQVDPM